MTERRVIKIGGSLLQNPRLVREVGDWLAAQPPAQNLVIVGGGAVIEAMRDLSRRFPLYEPAMHWRCIRLLRATYEVVGEILDEDWLRIDAPGQLTELLAAVPRQGQWLVAIEAFYSPVTGRRAGLPEGWATTSDAIAAYLARISGADELVLLKSCPIPADASVAQLAEAGVVDAALPDALPADVRLRVEQL